MKKTASIIVIVILLVFGCNNKKHQTIDEDKIVVNKSEIIKKDTTLIEVADLPILIDSTEYLIHPIGYVDKERKDAGYIYKSSRGNYDEFHLTNGYGDEITGSMSNLKFQSITSSKETFLTDDFIKIKSVRFLRNIFNNTSKKILLYEIVDTDTNNDGKVDLEDDEGLYISGINGGDYTKITKSKHKILEFRIVEGINRLYFKTVEKTTLKAKINIHYFYVDLANKNIEVVEYFPLK